MAVEAKEKQGTGFFAKLKARLNRGKAWLTGDLLGLGSRPLDEATGGTRREVADPKEAESYPAPASVRHAPATAKQPVDA